MGFNIKNTTCSYQDCTFVIVNGSCLAGIGFIGFFMSSALLLCFKFDVIKIPGPKKMFMTNVAVNDALIGIVAVIRGLGIISKKVVGVNEDGSVNAWCYIFVFLAYFVWSSIMFTKLPLTIDWFIALVFPHKYSKWITPKVTLVMIILSWAPMAITHLIHDPIAFLAGTMAVEYHRNYGRCIFDDLRPLLPIMTLVTPLLLIVLMYLMIFISMYRHKIEVGRLLVTTSAIVFSGILIVTPQILFFTLNLQMSYEAAQIFTVTLYHADCILNPLIYFIANPRIMSQIKARRKMVGRSLETMGGFSMAVLLTTPESSRRKVDGKQTKRQLKTKV